LFTDAVDSTLTTQRLGDERAGTLWTEHIDVRAICCAATAGARSNPCARGSAPQAPDARWSSRNTSAWPHRIRIDSHERPLVGWKHSPFVETVVDG